MASKLLHRVSIFDQLIGADGIQSFDLPTNPLSVILLTLRPLNDTGTLANYQTVRSIADAMNRVTVSHRGSAIFSMSGADLFSLNYFRHGMLPLEANSDNVTNERRAVVVPVVLGRFAYDKSSCVPASNRGELVLEIDFDIAATGYDGMRFSAETIELLDAKPKFGERSVSIAQTFAATGDNDIQLPSGNLLRGILGFGTTGFGGAAPAPTLGRMSLFVDGEQSGNASTDFEVASMLGALMGRQAPGYTHGHITDASAGGADNEPTQGPPIDFGTSDGMENYAYLDLDPTRDDNYSLDLKGANSVFLRSTAETANAARVIPIERIAW